MEACYPAKRVEKRIRELKNAPMFIKPSKLAVEIKSGSFDQLSEICFQTEL